MNTEMKTFEIKVAVTFEYTMKVPITKEEHSKMWDYGNGNYKVHEIEDLVSNLIDRANLTFADGDITDVDIISWAGVWENK